VPVSPRLHLNLNYPILLAVVVLYTSPVVAGLIGLIGSTDPREVRGQITVLKSMFNRSQYALSLLAASALFHSLASIRSPWYVLAPSVLLATAADYLVNVTMVSKRARWQRARK